MLRNKSIRQKLTMALLVTGGVILFLTVMAFWLYRYYNFRANATERVYSISKIIAANSTAALAFNNREDAEEILRSLEGESNIISGVLYDSTNTVFATFGRLSQVALPETLPKDGVRLEDERIVSSYPVIYANRRLGTLYIESDLKEVVETLKLYSIISVSVIVVCLLVTYFFAKLFQKTLADPILHLADTATEISENANYSLRAQKKEDDEVGRLTDAFNEMLTRIERQDDEIRQLNSSLEHKVAERTQELKYAYSEMEAFSYTVSHDLNAPLRRIETFVSMLLERSGHTVDPNTAKTLSIVANNARKMRSLIADLLRFSQLGKRELTRESVSMSKIVKDVCDEVARSMPDKGIQCTIGKLPDLMADAATITQVWANLISNAAKYASKAEEIRIDVGCIDESDQYVFFVKDNGSGFDMNLYDKLFKPFQRLHSSSEFDGTGVGLAIVERIVAKHGGRIWAKSKPGAGATFYFSIPKSSV